MWGDGPLGRDVAGSRETVSAVTREQMLEFLRTYYVPRRHRGQRRRAGGA